MKRISMLFLAVLLSAGYAYADSPRMILMEEFTNASCGPCASQNPTYQKFIEANSESVIPIAFHPSFPGDDIFYDHNPAMSDTRISYYSVDGVPSVRVNGVMPPDTDGNAYAGAPADTADIRKVMNNYTAMSPVDITLTETRNGNAVELNIEVASSVSLVGKKLRVAAAEFVCEYPEGETAPNGEEHFFWVARKMFDNATGSTIIDDNFSKKIDVTMDAAWDADQIYFIAWIQDDNSKEVLQAATTMKPTASSEVEPIFQDVTDYLSTVKRGESVSCDFEISNASAVELDYNFEVFGTEATGWTYSITPESATIAPGEKATVSVTINAGTQAAFVSAGVNVSVNSTEYFSYPKSSNFFSLLEETKYVYYQSHRADQLYTFSVMNSDFANDFAVLPNAEIIHQVYQPTNFDCVILTSYNYSLGVDLNQSPRLSELDITIAEAMMAQGKGVMLVSDISGYIAANSPSTTPKLNSFLSNKLGLEYVQTAPLYQTDESGNLTGFLNAKVDGIAGDPVTDGISYVLNSGQQQGNLNLFTEFWNVKDGSNAEPILKIAQQDGDLLTGFRLEDENKGRVIYISSGIEGNADLNMSIELMTKAITWLTANTGATGPKVAVTGADNNALAYGDVTLNSPSSKTITISNDGSENLTYTLTKKGVNPSIFTFEAKEVNMEYTVAPGESQEVTVIFTPTEEKDYSAELSIATNDENNEDISIALSGKGVSDAVPVIDIASEMKFSATSEPAEKTMVLTNTGAGELNISAILISGDDAAAFELISSQTGTVAAGETFEINVRFTPTEEKIYNATMTIQSNIDDVMVAIEGEGTSSVVDGWAGSVEFVSVNVGPNPVTETATVKYTVGAKAQMVDMYIVDANGNFVAQLVKDNNSVSGDAVTTFNVANMASGKYFIVANTGNYKTQLPFVIAK